MMPAIFFLVLACIAILCEGNIAISRSLRENEMGARRDVRGRPSTECGGMYYTPTGMIDFPSGRGFYSNDEFCEWILTAKWDERIEIGFIFFRTETEYDKVILSEGGENKVIYSGERVFPSWLSKTNQVSIIFESDWLLSDQGFILNWKFVKNENSTAPPTNGSSTTTTPPPATTTSANNGAIVGAAMSGDNTEGGLAASEPEPEPAPGFMTPEMTIMTTKTSEEYTCHSCIKISCEGEDSLDHLNTEEIPALDSMLCQHIEVTKCEEQQVQILCPSLCDV